MTGMLAESGVSSNFPRMDKLDTVEDKQVRRTTSLRLIWVSTGFMAVVATALLVDALFWPNPNWIKVMTSSLATAFFGWNALNIRRARTRGGELVRQLRDAPFHILDFDRPEEAAAFVAAFTRQLDAPRFQMPDDRDLIEVSSITHKGVTLYLSDLALEMTKTVFATPPATREITNADLPKGRTLLIAGPVKKPLGLDDVLPKLAPQRLLDA